MQEILEKKTKNYIDFIKQVCGDPDNSYETKIIDLFSSELQKIANGKIVAQNREDLVLQLRNAREKCGYCTIDLLETVIATEKKIAVILFTFQGEKIIAHTTMAMLYFDHEGKIFKIKEVFNLYNEGW